MPARGQANYTTTTNGIMKRIIPFVLALVVACASATGLLSLSMASRPPVRGVVAANATTVRPIPPVALTPFLHIYQYGVGHGDCAMICVRDQKSASDATIQRVCIIIDCGKVSQANMPNLWTTMLEDMKKSFRTPDDPTAPLEVDYFVVSHMHYDHMANAATLLKKIKPPTGTTYGTNLQVVDRLYTIHSADWYDIFKAPDPDAQTMVDNYKTATQPTYKHRNIRAGQYLVELNKFKMQCVAANGYVIDGNTPTCGMRNVGVTTCGKPRNENDLSFAWVIEFDDFRYFTGGDIAGVNTGEWNLEQRIVDYYKIKKGLAPTNGAPYPYHMCAMKVSHHGSVTSSTQEFVNYFQPKVAVFSARKRKFSTTTNEGLPQKTIVDRLRTFPKLPTGTNTCDLYYTYIPFPGDAANCDDKVYYERNPSGSQALDYRDILIAVGKQQRGPTALSIASPVAMEIGQRVRSKADLKLATQDFTWPGTQPTTCNRH